MPPRPFPPGLSPDDCIVLFDGVCNLCNGGVQFIIARDPGRRLRFASMQSLRGQSLLAWCDLPLDHHDTMVLIEKGRAYFRSTAVLRILRYLSWPWPVFCLAMAIPPFLRNWLYDLVAQHRYQVFGRSETCMLPSPELQSRFFD